MPFFPLLIGLMFDQVQSPGTFIAQPEGKTHESHLVYVCLHSRSLKPCAEFCFEFQIRARQHLEESSAETGPGRAGPCRRGGGVCSTHPSLASALHKPRLAPGPSAGPCHPRAKPRGRGSVRRDAPGQVRPERGGTGERAAVSALAGRCRGGWAPGEGPPQGRGAVYLRPWGRDPRNVFRSSPPRRLEDSRDEQQSEKPRAPAPSPAPP